MLKASDLQVNMNIPQSKDTQQNETVRKKSVVETVRKKTVKKKSFLVLFNE